jgi:hypothetical protein
MTFRTIETGIPRRALLLMPVAYLGLDAIFNRRERPVPHRAHPDRFVRQSPKPLPLPSDVWINKPVPTGQKTKEESH